MPFDQRASVVRNPVLPGVNYPHCRKGDPTTAAYPLTDNRGEPLESARRAPQLMFGKESDEIAVGSVHPAGDYRSLEVWQVRVARPALQIGILSVPAE
jgi:hypothetical protein